MKVKLDDEVLFEIDETMLKLLAHDLLDPVEDIKRRLRYIIEHKCDRCYERLEKEYKQKLIDDPEIPALPKSRRDMANLMLSHKEYKNRAQREQEAKERENGQPV